MNSGTARLTELRRRTDRQLLVLVGKELDRSLDLANRGAVAEAEARLAKARALLAVVRAPDSQRSELERRVEEVRSALDRRRNQFIGRAQSAWC